MFLVAECVESLDVTFPFSDIRELWDNVKESFLSKDCESLLVEESLESWLSKEV